MFHVKHFAVGNYMGNCQYLPESCEFWLFSPPKRVKMFHVKHFDRLVW